MYSIIFPLFTVGSQSKLATTTSGLQGWAAWFSWADVSAASVNVTSCIPINPGPKQTRNAVMLNVNSIGRYVGQQGQNETVVPLRAPGGWTDTAMPRRPWSASSAGISACGEEVRGGCGGGGVV